MHLIAGLGNPGEKYKKTRHNVGFIILDSFNLSFEKDKYSTAWVFKDSFHDQEVLFVKPETFMNESGQAISHLKEKYVISTENILVIYDDIDLPLGDIRISYDRGDGGHNGIKSIVKKLGTSAFVRLRVGIAPKGNDGRAIKPKGGFFTPANKAVSNYVLKDFSTNDFSTIESLLPKTQKIVKDFVLHGKEKVMNEYN